MKKNGTFTQGRAFFIFTFLHLKKKKILLIENLNVYMNFYNKIEN